jgi:hypothetical protein
MTCWLLPCSPVLWCRADRVKHVPFDNYDLAPDGERVPVLMPVEPQEARGRATSSSYELLRRAAALRAGGHTIGQALNGIADAQSRQWSCFES